MKLSKFPYEARIKKAQNYLDYNNIDAMIITKPENSYYFTLFQAIIYSRPIMAIISKVGDSILLVPYLDLDHAKEKSPVTNIIGYRSDEEINESIRNAIKNYKIIGTDSDSLSFYNKITKLSHNLKIVDVTDFINDIRSVKDYSEIERIKIASEVTDYGMKEVIEGIKERDTEINIASRAEFSMKMKLSEILGVDGLYPWMNFTVSAVISGKRSYYPHGLVSGKKINEGESVIVTLDIAVEGYRAENERTFLVGKVSEDMEQAFNYMEKAQQMAFKSIKECVSASDIDRSVMDFFRSNDLIKYVNHRTGHGIGLEIHEFPSIAEGNNTIIKSDMTLAIEPGLYIKNIGGFRHSDTVLVKGKDIEILTKTSKGIEKLKI
ncbi:MAG: M24 family metallopeptidase [Caldisphaera sp.]